MPSKKIYEISGGPSRFDLLFSILDRGPANRRFVSFMVDGIPSDVKLNSLSRNDASGESWSFRGFARGSIISPGYSIKGRYSSQHRSGNFELIDQ